MLLPDYAWLLFYLTALGLSIGTIILFFIYKMNKIDKEINIQKYKVHIENIDADSSKDIQAILDNFVQECLDDYLATHPEMSDHHYITDEEEIVLRSEIANMVSLRMSDAMYNKLSIYYNPYTIASIIAEKIYIKITIFVVNNNTDAD